MRVAWRPSSTSDSDLVGDRKVPAGLRSHRRSRNRDHVLILGVAFWQKLLFVLSY